MRLKTTLLRFLGFSIFLLTFSCTLVEDGDVISPTDFNKLKLKSIQITQTLNAGNFALDVPVTIGTNGKIATINWPDLGNHKLKFRTPVTGPAVSILTYSSNGFLLTFDTQVNSVSVEKYTFDHDTNANLTSLVSVGSFGTISDVLTYTSGALSKITRNTSVNSTVTIDNYGALNAMDTYQSSGPCGNSSNTFTCGNYSNNNGSGSNALSLSKTFTFNRPESVNFTDNRGQNNSRNPDVYYFHPLMIISEYFNNNKPLVSAYFRDWWSIGGTGNSNYTVQETVSITYLYAN